MANRKQRVAAALTAVLAIGAAVGGGGVATASSGAGDDGGLTAAEQSWFSEVATPSAGGLVDAVDLPATSVAVPLQSARVSGPAAAAAGISCTTTAHNPHPSSHVPGTINAEVRQVCNVAVAKNSTEAKLWEHRWWGYNVIDGPRYSDLQTRKQSSVFVNAGCRTNSIRVTGYGHFEVSGVHYVSQEVMNTKDVSC